ncbi:MAG: hypothetical protein K9W44_05890 [Candidatus Lokiarchaeota archaeon]|nr:hypothetical protein [Candidatus Harpocratesius repetitus]
MPDIKEDINKINEELKKEINEQFSLKGKLAALIHDMGIKGFKDIGINKQLAKFGDAITNTIYSMAKSAVIHQFTQRKVNRTVLSHALKNAQMKPFAKTRSDAHAMADSAEAFIGYVFCAEGWNLEKMATQLYNSLKNYNLYEQVEETQAAIEGFTKLLENIKEYLEYKYRWES